MRPFGAVSRWAGFLLGLALVLALGLTPVKAQTGGTVSGVVTDSTGAVVVGANVSLIDSKTHSARNTTTNGAGRYVFTNVDPGPYDFTFSQTGFEMATQSYAAPSGWTSCNARSAEANANCRR